MSQPAAKSPVDQAIDAILLANNIHPEVRNSDSLDFHDLSIVQIRTMLAAAWLVGRVGKEG